MPYYVDKYGIRYYTPGFPFEDPPLPEPNPSPPDDLIVETGDMPVQLEIRDEWDDRSGLEKIFDLILASKETAIMVALFLLAVIFALKARS